MGSSRPRVRKSAGRDVRARSRGEYHVVNSLGWHDLRPLPRAPVGPVVDGRDCLLIAPAASGKTEAGLFGAVRMAAEEARPVGLVGFVRMSRVIKLALAVGAFLRANWPRILGAWTVISTYIEKHPNVPDEVRRRLEQVRDRLVAARRQKSEEAQIRAMLDVVTGVAAGLEPGGSPRSSYAERAERLRMALGVAEQLSGREKRRAVKSIRGKTDALAAEAIESLLPADRQSDEPAPGDELAT